MKPGGMVLVAGCGRSGTTLLGETLAASPDFAVSIEEQPQFGMLDRMVLDRRLIPSLLPAVIDVYRRNAERCAPRHYGDKSHQVLWVAEEVCAALDGARILAVERDPRGVVASMLRHQGVLAHFGRWRSHPVPNPYLGIDRAVARGYAELDMVTRCALRVRSHRARLRELRRALPADRLLVLGFEDFVTSPAAECARISDWLAHEVVPPAARAEAAERWRDTLTPREQALVEDVVARGLVADGAA